ncbi:MAG: hypothetical protein WA793_13480 [Sphingorhabdus sp.]|uniref:hypothetical protein n=1 Tax=Sphingorhabdus sp. TaxID=1902408 RepID=UPI003C9CC513
MIKFVGFPCFGGVARPAGIRRLEMRGTFTFGFDAVMTVCAARSDTSMIVGRIRPSFRTFVAIFTLITRRKMAGRFA